MVVGSFERGETEKVDGATQDGITVETEGVECTARGMVDGKEMRKVVAAPAGEVREEATGDIGSSICPCSTVRTRMGG